jgi:glyoxylate utilization-related uncharacterized protein
MLTFIDTNKLPKVKTAEGEFTEVLNRDLCGAKNVVATLRWVKPGKTFRTAASEKHQLLYLMDGRGTVRMDNKDYQVTKGAGVYLAPSETATIQAAANDSVKIFHLVVPKIPS